MNAQVHTASPWHLPATNAQQSTEEQSTEPGSNDPSRPSDQRKSGRTATGRSLDSEPRPEPVGIAPDELPRQFVLYRHSDISGVSGIGVVAWGTAYHDGKTVTRWRGMGSGIAQISVWDHWQEVIDIHGHDGATELIWLDTGRWYPD